MSKSFLERIETYPELKKHVARMLDVVENIEGKADLADDAEMQVVENMRKLGFAVLEEWAIQREQSVESDWEKEHPTAVKHGKKKFIGEQP